MASIDTRGARCEASPHGTLVLTISALTCAGNAANSSSDGYACTAPRSNKEHSVPLAGIDAPADGVSDVGTVDSGYSAVESGV